MVTSERVLLARVSNLDLPSELIVLLQYFMSQSQSGAYLTFFFALKIMYEGRAQPVKFITLIAVTYS